MGAHPADDSGFLTPPDSWDAEDLAWKLGSPYHAIFGEAISDSITKAVIKSWSCRLSHEPQTAATSSRSAGHSLAPMEIGWVKGKGQVKSKNKEKGKGKGKSKGKGKEKPKSEKFEAQKRLDSSSPCVKTQT